MRTLANSKRNGTLVSETVAMILAAGLGTRLRPLTEHRPKSLIPIANRPALSFALDRLRAASIDEIWINAHHMHAQLQNYASTSGETGLRVITENELLGTAGGIRHALFPRFATQPFAHAVIMNADTLLDVNLEDALRAHKATAAPATLLITAPERGTESLASVYTDASGKVVSLLGPPPRSTPSLKGPFIFTGCQVINAELLALLPSEGCIVRKAYQPWLSQGFELRTMQITGTWRDIGTLQSYLATNLDFANGALRWPSVDRKKNQSFNATPDRLIPGPHESVIWGEGVSVGAAVQVRHAVVGAGVVIADHVTLSNAVVWPQTRVERSAHNAVLTPFGCFGVETL